MDSGKLLRLGRFTHRGAAVVVPMDHAIFAEPPEPLADLPGLVRLVAQSEADGILVTAGMLPHVAEAAAGRLAIIARIDGSHTRLGKNIERCDLVTTPEHALALGADMVVVNGYFGADNEDSQMIKIGQTAARCRELGLPLMAETIPVSWLGFHFGRGKKAPPPDQAHRDIWLSCRTGAELGADLIKTHYTGDPAGFRQIVRSVPVPIWIAGGPLRKSGDAALLEMVSEAVQAGVGGVIIGRNVWQRPNPKDMIRQLCRIAHRR